MLIVGARLENPLGFHRIRSTWLTGLWQHVAAILFLCFPPRSFQFSCCLSPTPQKTAGAFPCVFAHNYLLRAQSHLIKWFILQVTSLPKQTIRPWWSCHRCEANSWCPPSCWWCSSFREKQFQGKRLMLFINTVSAMQNRTPLSPLSWVSLQSHAYRWAPYCFLPLQCWNWTHPWLDAWVLLLSL